MQHISDSRPADWPATGELDLCVHDLPHASSTTEWWYVNTHLTTSEGLELSLFAAFFRVLVTHADGTSEHASEMG